VRSKAAAKAAFLFQADGKRQFLNSRNCKDAGPLLVFQKYVLVTTLYPT